MSRTIVGSGLLAEALAASGPRGGGALIYAAGVSNSTCTDPEEFARERDRLLAALGEWHAADAFVYFGTCSAMDAEARTTPYVQHKLAMEELVRRHRRHLILRLPQVAGRTPNPHTLLNYLYNRIARSESFPLWVNARRSIIDVEDVARIVEVLLAKDDLRNVLLNVANPTSYPMPYVVSVMERLIGKPAIFHRVERGSAYFVDTSHMSSLAAEAGVDFDDTYLERVVKKYYGHSR